MTTNGPLQGIRVLDLTRVLSGPHCTRMLADLGAEVIKIEAPQGDVTRLTNPRVNGLATYFIQQNVGKRSVSLDLTKPAGVELVLALADHCDVLVENFRPGVMDRLGLDYATVTRRNPRMVYASITGYGATGPWVGRRAYAPVVGAETGITKAQGDEREGVYTNDPHSHADVYTSLECASGILAALYQRERTGLGDHLDVSMAQTMIYVAEHAHDQLFDGEVSPDWIRSFQTGDYPVVTAANGEVAVISGHPADRGTFDLFMTAIGRTDILDDPGMATVSARLARYDELFTALTEWAATMPSADAIEEQLSHHQLATGRLRSLREVCDTPWAAERQAVVNVSDRGDGTVRIPNAPWRFANSDIRTEGNPRYRGEDNRAVLTELLGLESATLDGLEAAGVLSSRMPRPR